MAYVVSGMSGGKIRSFTDLRAWQEGHRLVLMIYDISKKFPDDEKFGLTNQLRRAAVSVTSNLAEGFRRSSKRDKCQFYRTALASLTEIQNQLLIARDVRYITAEYFSDIANHSVQVSKMVHGLMKSATGLKHE